LKLGKDLIKEGKHHVLMASGSGFCGVFEMEESRKHGALVGQLRKFAEDEWGRSEFSGI
jgi:hypothetical protein